MATLWSSLTPIPWIDADILVPQQVPRRSCGGDERACFGSRHGIVHHERSRLLFQCLGWIGIELGMAQGLLESAKDAIDIVVIDHVDKAPTEN
jgi:hypothetical protein